MPRKWKSINRRNRRFMNNYYYVNQYPAFPVVQPSYYMYPYSNNNWFANVQNYSLPSFNPYCWVPTPPSNAEALSSSHYPMQSQHEDQDAHEEDWSKASDGDEESGEESAIEDAQESEAEEIENVHEADDIRQGIEDDEPLNTEHVDDGRDSDSESQHEDQDTSDEDRSEVSEGYEESGEESAAEDVQEADEENEDVQEEDEIHQGIEDEPLNSTRHVDDGRDSGSEEDDDNTKKCTICLCPMDGNVWKCSTCINVSCYICMEIWWTHAGTCPLCRSEVYVLEVPAL